MAATIVSSSTDNLPLLSPLALDVPSSFDVYPPEYHAPRPSQTQISSHSQTQPTISSPHQIDTTDAHSLLPPYSPPVGSYRGHASEAEYLAALRAWAEEKMYMQPADKCALPGFYGKETMRECITKNPELGLRSKLGRGKRKASKGQGVEEAAAIGEDREQEVRGLGGAAEGVQRRETDGEVSRARRKSSLGGWLTRKRTA